MSDYARQHDFNSKTGTTIFGSEVDEEFDALLTAVNSKTDESREGSASGIATLDGSALIPAGISGTPASGGGQLPEASLTALGAVELATSAETITGTDALRAVTPATLDAVMENAGGLLGDIKDLADPNADRILFWDDSDGATEFLTVGDGLEISVNTLQLPAAIAGDGITLTSGVLSLSTTAAGDGLAIASGVLSVNVTDGLDIVADTLGIIDVAAGAAQPVVITNGTFTFDLSSITTMSIEDLNVAQDGIVMSDNGTIKVMPYDEAGVDVINAADAIQTFALADANTMQVLDSATTRVWTIPTNAAVAFKIGTVILLHAASTAEIDVTADTGVTLTSVFNTAGTTATTDTVSAGGTAALVKTKTDEWLLSGDIIDV
jgi:hypothetical protein